MQAGGMYLRYLLYIPFSRSVSYSVLGIPNLLFSFAGIETRSILLGKRDHEHCGIYKAWPRCITWAYYDQDYLGVAKHFDNRFLCQVVCQAQDG